MAESKYGKYIVTELKAQRFTPEYAARYAQFAKRILWIDNQVVEGAFQMNCSWYLRPPVAKMPEMNPHTHDADEIIGFFGSNPEKPYDLGGEIEFRLEDEKHVLVKSCLIFVPGGVEHHMTIKRVDRPIFHFSTVTTGQYELIKAEEKSR